MGGNNCCCFGFFIGLVLIGALFSVFLLKRSDEDVTVLKQIHVVFSNGQRTPSSAEIDIFPLGIDKNSSFFPYGLEALTNEGKTTMFEMGGSLRSHYENFFPNVYHQNDMIMQTADSNFAKMSALSLLAGLWEANEESEFFEGLKWTPIPYKNLHFSNDFMLYEQNCPRYIHEKERVNEIYLKNMYLPYKNLFQQLSYYTGTNITEPSQVLLLHNLLMTQEDMNRGNPKWVKNVKKSMKDIVRLEYSIKLHNTLMKKLSAGPLLQKIISDSKQRIHDDRSGKSGVKSYFYSGHLNNVAAVLAATGLVRPQQPEFGALFIVELHLRLLYNDYIYKVLYWDIDTAMPQLLKLPHCDTLCRLEEFEEQMKDILTSDYFEECKPYS